MAHLLHEPISGAAGRMPRAASGGIDRALLAGALAPLFSQAPA